MEFRTCGTIALFIHGLQQQAQSLDNEASYVIQDNSTKSTVMLVVMHVVRIVQALGMPWYAEEPPNQSLAHTARPGKAPLLKTVGVGGDLSLFPVSDEYSIFYSKVFSMTDSSRCVFVNGPDIASPNSKYDGRAIRSAMMRRTLREKQRSSKPRPLSLKWVRICRCRPANQSFEISPVSPTFLHGTRDCELLVRRVDRENTVSREKTEESN
jgi:hypothetical protein